VNDLIVLSQDVDALASVFSHDVACVRVLILTSPT